MYGRKVWAEDGRDENEGRSISRNAYPHLFFPSLMDIVISDLFSFGRVCQGISQFRVPLPADDVTVELFASPTALRVTPSIAEWADLFGPFSSYWLGHLDRHKRRKVHLWI